MFGKSCVSAPLPRRTKITLALKIIWNDLSFCVLIKYQRRSSPLSLRQQKADMMKRKYGLLLGNSITYPRYKTQSHNRRWLWLLLTAAVLAAAALSSIGA